MPSVQLDDLPMEVFEQITQYLSLNECVRLERVNSEWRNVMRKQWRRLKIVDFDDLLFCEIIYFLEKNNDASYDPGTVCLQELAVKVHNHVQTIFINSWVLGNRHVLAFMKKLYELSTPKLRELALYSYCEDVPESDAEIMAEVAQYIPLTLESLKLTFNYDNCNVMKNFCDGFYQQTFPQLKCLSISYDGLCDFRMNVLQTPNLKELETRLGSKTADIDNLDQLTDLEILSLRLHPDSNVLENFWCQILETATSHDSKFLQTLKKLEVNGDCNDEQLLSQIGRFSGLEVLKLPWMIEIDPSGQLRILQSIGQGCDNLTSLHFEGEVSEEVLIEVADGFHNLSCLFLYMSSVQELQSFVNRLSVDRCMHIRCSIGPTVAEVQTSGILHSHPNIRYS